MSSDYRSFTKAELLGGTAGRVRYHKYLIGFFKPDHNFYRVENRSSHKFVNNPPFEVLPAKVCEKNASRQSDVVNKVFTNCLRLPAPAVGAPDFQNVSF